MVKNFASKRLRDVGPVGASRPFPFTAGAAETAGTSRWKRCSERQKSQETHFYAAMRKGKHFAGELQEWAVNFGSMLQQLLQALTVEAHPDAQPWEAGPHESQELNHLHTHTLLHDLAINKLVHANTF